MRFTPDQDYNENNALNITGVSIPGLDAAEGSDTLQVTLFVEHGRLSLPEDINQWVTLAVNQIDGKSMTLKGGVDKLNAALALLKLRTPDQLHIPPMIWGTTATVAL